MILAGNLAMTLESALKDRDNISSRSGEANVKLERKFVTRKWPIIESYTNEKKKNSPPNYGFMLQNLVPKFRARVLDLLIGALDAHQEIQKHKDDEFELEARAPDTLEQVEAACDAALRELATFPETKKSDISAFYPPADYRLLCSYTEDLLSWSKKTRTWMIEAKKKGLLHNSSNEEKCVEGKASMNGPPVGRIEESFDHERLSKQTSSILQRLVAIQTTMEEEMSRCRHNPRKSLESFRSRQDVQKWSALNTQATSPAATRAVNGPDTTDVEEASETLARAMSAYKNCRWRFHHVETEHSHVLENAQQAIMPATKPDDWKDTAYKAIKQLLTEHRQEITDMITQSPSIESVAAAREEIHSKFLTELEYPLQAIHLLTEYSKSQRLKEGHVETQSESQDCIELPNAGEERK